MSDSLPGWQVQAAESWKFTAPIGKAVADRLTEGWPELEALDPAPVVVASEPDPAAPDRWQLDAYFEGLPSNEALAMLEAIVDTPGTLARVEDADWATVSQAWLRPIRAGRFYIHTAAHADAIPADAIAFRIEASRAFGTGHHETTAGCLEILSDLHAREGGFARIADLGTGTGLLAFAAHALWPSAHVVATDIDPVAIPVVRENMAGNGIAADALVLAVADGTDHPALAVEPFDLVTANILAGPLIALAVDIARIVRPGGLAVLAGLLGIQESAVVTAYEAAGFARHLALSRGDWSILALRRA